MSFPGSDFADAVERKLFRGWFDWDTWGDPVTWIHHGLWALVFTGVGALCGWPFGLAGLGASIGSKCALGFYLLREGLSRNGWDSVMDCVGPALVAWWWW